jgi:hypothetical protein
MKNITNNSVGLGRNLVSSVSLPWPPPYIFSFTIYLAIVFNYLVAARAFSGSAMGFVIWNRPPPPLFPLFGAIEPPLFH